MKKSEYDRLIGLLEKEGFDVHSIGEDKYFMDNKDRLGVVIYASIDKSESVKNQP